MKPGKIIAQDLSSKYCSNGDVSRYHSYEEADAVFNQWTKEFPNLAAKHSIGKSVQGRELLVLQITNGVTGERDLRRPMFKWVEIVFK